jgi:sugar (pentulose or hexulose) kinase
MRHILAIDQGAGTIDSWLIWRLTGGAVHATDPTNASRTLLFDIGQREWSDELCSTFGVPRHMLPSVHPSSGEFGVTRAEFFDVELPILGVAGDQQAALFGQGCWAAGEAKTARGGRLWEVPAAVSETQGITGKVRESSSSLRSSRLNLFLQTLEVPGGAPEMRGRR